MEMVVVKSELMAVRSSLDHRSSSAQLKEIETKKQS